MVFDDRGLYRPGEDVKVKGWVRLIAHGPTGDVEAAPAAVQSVAYVLKDSQGNEVAKGTAAVGALGRLRSHPRAAGDDEPGGGDAGAVDHGPRPRA